MASADVPGMDRRLPPTRRRRLTEADERAWASFVQFVARFPRDAEPAGPPAPVSVAAPVIVSAPPSPAANRPVRSPPLPLEIGTAPGGVDRSTWSRFRSGKLPAERNLDLHGRTVPRAHADLLAFVLLATADRLRCVEVVTGRGSGEGGGAIRREFPLWLNQSPLRGLILAATHPHAANTGAVRLLLRRTR